MVSLFFDFDVAEKFAFHNVTFLHDCISVMNRDISVRDLDLRSFS